MNLWSRSGRNMPSTMPRRPAPTKSRPIHSPASFVVQAVNALIERRTPGRIGAGRERHGRHAQRVENKCFRFEQFEVFAHARSARFEFRGTASDAPRPGSLMTQAANAARSPGIPTTKKTARHPK